MPSDPHWQRVCQIFEAAIEVPDDDRSDWLRERCSDDPEILTQVRALLAAHDREGVLDRPLPGSSDLLTARLQGALSDRYGRRPILLVDGVAHVTRDEDEITRLLT